MRRKYKKLLGCIVLDAIGFASTAFPLIDAIWAPVAASISYRMFGEKRGKYTSIITFLEEILPFTDFVPSFTVFWFLFDFSNKEERKEQGIPENNTSKQNI